MLGSSRTADGSLTRAGATTIATPGRRGDVWLWMALMAPYVLIAAVRSRSDWFPVQDQAVLDLRLGQLLDGSAPLVGAFSRFGWSHPGPIWFFVLAPFRAVGGPAGILAGSTLWFGAGFATMAVVVRRRFGVSACTVAVLASLAAIAGAGAFTVLVPWNPHLAFAWFPLVLVLCVSSVAGHPRDLAPAVFVGSALVQLHVGYLVLVGVPVAATIIVIAAGHRRGITTLAPNRWVRSSRWWAAATIVVWLPPMIDQVLHRRNGNVWQLAMFLLDTPADAGPPTGWSFGASMLGGAARFPFVGLGGHAESIERFSQNIAPGSPWLLLIVLALFALGAVACIAGRDERSTRALVVVAASWAGGLVALSRILGERWPYLFVWRYVLVWFLAAVVAVVCARAMRTRYPTLGSISARRATTLLILATTLAGVSVLVRTATWDPGSFRAREHRAEQLSERLLAGPRPDGPVTLVRFGTVFDGIGDGVLNAAVDAGWDLRVPSELGFKYGRPLSHDPTPDEDVWLVTEGSADTTIAEMTPGARVLAKVTPLDEPTEAELSQLQRNLLRDLAEQGRTDLAGTVGSSVVAFAIGEAGIRYDPDDMSRLVELNRRVERSTDRSAVIAVPADGPTDVGSVLATAG